ncbi:MAG: hypothetical protein AABN95_06050 [Acidobacteriota bacterium]
MNCQSFENSVTDLARRHPFEATALEEVLAHSESCAACALRLEEQRSLSLGLRSLAEEMKAVPTPAQVEARLLEAFRGQVLLPGRAQGTTRRWIAVAAAAVLLVAFGLIALRLTSTPAPLPIRAGEQKPFETVATHQVAPGPLTTSTPVLSFNQDKRVRPGNRTSRRPAAKLVAKHRPKPTQDPGLTAVNANAVAEVMTDFMPLGDTSTANLQEGAQMVRVEMPRYAMARFGLPVNMERYDERVKADLWVSVDGLARAIRFVQ